MIPSKEQALACSDRVVASGHMCAGCYGDSYCRISEKFAEAYPKRTLLRDVVLLIATGGASAYRRRELE